MAESNKKGAGRGSKGRGDEEEDVARVHRRGSTSTRRGNKSKLYRRLTIARIIAQLWSGVTRCFSGAVRLAALLQDDDEEDEDEDDELYDTEEEGLLGLGGNGGLGRGGPGGAAGGAAGAIAAFHANLPSNLMRHLSQEDQAAVREAAATIMQAVETLGQRYEEEETDGEDEDDETEDVVDEDEDEEDGEEGDDDDGDDWDGEDPTDQEVESKKQRPKNQRPVKHKTKAEEEGEGANSSGLGNGKNKRPVKHKTKAEEEAGEANSSGLDNGLGDGFVGGFCLATKEELEAGEWDTPRYKYHQWAGDSTDRSNSTTDNEDS